MIIIEHRRTLLKPALEVMISGKMQEGEVTYGLIYKIK